MVSFWRPLSPLFSLFWVNQKGVFSTFLKVGKFYGFEHEYNFEQVHEIRRNGVTWMKQFFWFIEKKIVFPFVTQYLFSTKKYKLSKVTKNDFWWYIRACFSQFSSYRVFVCQNWIKNVCLTVFNFFIYINHYLIQLNGPPGTERLDTHFLRNC